MAKSLKTCPHCKIEFVGRPNKKYCSDQCRWNDHALGRSVQSEIDKPKVDRSKLGKQNRSKGARAEREVCDILTAISGSKVKRNLSQTRDAGSDVQWGPFLLEVKYQQTYALPAWQRQACIAAKEADAIPAVVYRRPQEQFWISLPFDVFVTLFETLRKAAEGHV